MPTNYKNIDEFDKEWEEKLLKEETQENDEVEQENEIELEEEVFNEEEIVDEDEEEEIQEEDEEKDNNSGLKGNEEFIDNSPKHEDKEKYAFIEMRKKLKEAEEKAKEKDASLKQWEEIARQLGYQNSEELLKAQKEKTIKEEATRKGIDPDIYRELIQLKEKVGEYEKKQQQTFAQTRLEKFSKSLEDISKTYSFSQEEKNQILTEMEQDGYNLESLYEIKNPTKFIMGYAADKITERKVQEKLSKTNKENFKEEKFNNPKTSKKSIEELQRELIKKEMEEYARKSGLNY